MLCQWYIYTVIRRTSGHSNTSEGRNVVYRTIKYNRHIAGREKEVYYTISNTQNAEGKQTKEQTNKTKNSMCLILALI